MKRIFSYSIASLTFAFLLSVTGCANHPLAAETTPPAVATTIAGSQAATPPVTIPVPVHGTITQQQQVVQQNAMNEQAWIQSHGMPGEPTHHL